MKNQDLAPRFKQLYEKFGFSQIQDKGKPYYKGLNDGLAYRVIGDRKLKPLRQWLSGEGDDPNKKYYYVKLKTKTGDFKDFRVNRLIAIDTMPNPDNKPIVDHINGDRHDNRIENLRWATAKENARNRKKRGAADEQIGND